MTRRAVPVRTCVGCRERSAKSDLLRIVAEPPVAAGASGVLTPDPRGRMPGRGAHLHPDPECLALAERRRAFGRALRADGPLDATAVQAWIDAHRAGSNGSNDSNDSTTAGQPAPSQSREGGPQR